MQITFGTQVKTTLIKLKVKYELRGDPAWSYMQQLERSDCTTGAKGDETKFWKTRCFYLL